MPSKEEATPKHLDLTKPTLEQCGFSLLTQIKSPQKETYDEAAQLLKKGELVAIPTETVYGLAANALNAEACRKIFSAKNRPFLDPLIVHVSEIDAARNLAHVTEDAEKIAAKFWPGALTLILKKKPIIPDIVSAELPTVAVRCPNHPVAQKLLELSALPLAAPSANQFGYISPTCAEHVYQSLKGKIHLILDGGPCPMGIESTILDLSEPKSPKILRPGKYSAEELSNALGKKVSYQSELHESLINAPGLLDSHYSPKTKLILFKKKPQTTRENIPPEQTAYLFLSENNPLKAQYLNAHSFSPSGDLKDVANQLYQKLRELDRKGYRLIQAESPAPDTGLSIAINDRLQKAAHKN